MHALRSGHQRQRHWRHLCGGQLHCLWRWQVQQRWLRTVHTVRPGLLLRRGLVRELCCLCRWLLLLLGRLCVHAVLNRDLCQQQREHLRALPCGKGSARRWQRLRP